MMQAHGLCVSGSSIDILCIFELHDEIVIMELVSIFSTSELEISEKSSDEQVLLLLSRDRVIEIILLQYEEILS